MKNAKTKTKTAPQREAPVTPKSPKKVNVSCNYLGTGQTIIRDTTVKNLQQFCEWVEFLLPNRREKTVDSCVVRRSNNRDEAKKTRRQVADDLGIAIKTLDRWRSESRANPNEAFRGHGNRTAEQEQLRQLQREVESLKREREILKKTLVIFTQP